MSAKRLVLIIAVALVTLFSSWMAGFTTGRSHPLLLEKGTVHHHEWSEWAAPAKIDGDRPSRSYIQFHTCTNCGFSEFRFIGETH